MRIVILIAILHFFVSDLIGQASGQTSYSGFIDKDPIELVTNIYSDGNARGIYAFKKNNTPIVLQGKIFENSLTFFELSRDSIALTFNNFDRKQKTIVGTWKDFNTKKALTITLHKEFEIEDGEGVEWTDREIIQPVSFKNQYFKLLISKRKNDYYAHVSGVKINQKKTDSLIQQINLNCQLMSLNSISLGDYNFDGYLDFEVLERSYAGPNTSSLYFLYNPKTKQYFNSGFAGVSLEFDAKSKTIFERNECCGGSNMTTATYRVLKNKMVLIEQHCYIWDEKKQDLIEHKMKDCE
jgi:hypothetical protein